MHVREIPKQIFDSLADGRLIETHNLHELIKKGSLDRSLNLINVGSKVVTCNMDSGIWLRLAEATRTTSIEVVLADTTPIDNEDLSARVFETRKRLARLDAGSYRRYMSTTVDQTVYFESTIDPIELHYPFNDASLRSARIIHAAPIIGEVARKGFELLLTGNYETSSFDEDELNL